jgi:hypothetical protein
MKRRAAEPAVYTTLTRVSGDDTDELDVVIAFEVTRYSPGCPACYYQRNGDPGWPAEAAEYETAITGISLDGAVDAGVEPLTDAEVATLTAWFESDKAHDATDDAVREYYDDAYDRYCDEQMERSL